MTDEMIRMVVKKYADAAQQILGSQLYAVILFGSCARGDYDSESDIDLLVLLHAAPEEIPVLRRKMRPVADSLDLEYDCVISTVFQSKQVFDTHKPVSVFYQTVEREGKRIG
ncbi:MAG: nucleotidyltransferase domain-containing protein [Peptococcaceae bacterium]|nr:nucleotidyltransferase domain-containing protein [Peptococcaceae bacterium]